jgi:hypothetical protein
MAKQRVDGQNPKRCQATHSKKEGSAISREGAMIFGIGKLWDSFFFLCWAAWLFA